MQMSGITDNPDRNPFEPINETVYKYLHNAIINLEYKPGTALIESKIASELGISRSPVKAALQRLEQENLVEREPGKSPRVAGIKYEDCAALLEARRGIESWAAFYAAGRITNGELERLGKALLRMRESGRNKSPEECARADADFHQIIIDASHNGYLSEAYSLISGNLLRYRIYIMKKMGMRDLFEFEHHMSIYRAMENHCATVAREEMLVSIDNMVQAMRYL